MTMIQFPKRIEFGVIPVEEWQGTLRIRFATAEEKPAPGQPGKDVGEISSLRSESDASGDRQVAVVSLGQKEKVSRETLRRAGGAVASWLIKKSAGEAGIDLASLRDLNIERPEIFLAEGIGLGAYRFERYKSSQPAKPPIQVSFLTGGEPAGLDEALEKVQVITSAVNLAREWGHEPANVINPLSLAERAQEVAGQSGLKCTVLDDTELDRMGAGALLSVGKGSRTPSRLIVLEYPGQAPEANTDPVVLVGKAITFDTGGYSIKDTSGIQGMKYDKCGGLVVIATLWAAAQLKLKTPLVGLIPAAENMISSEAYRPDDILTSLSGKTIEVLSTDAEGRLVLADALTYAQRMFKPRAVIDLATLTGGVVVALGHIRAGMMANDDRLAGQLLSAGEAAYERLWRLPLDEEYFELIKGDEADIKNSGGREGAPIFGGIFLKQFVDDQVPWAHLDIAGMASTSKDLPYCPKGATGFGVRLLLEYLEAF